MKMFLYTSIAQGILNLIIHSLMSASSNVWFCATFSWRLFMCVLSIWWVLLNEWDRPELAEALMDMPKEKSLSLLQSRREKGIVALWGSQRLQSHFLRSVLSRCGIGVKNPSLLRNEYQHQTHSPFWCLNHALCPEQRRAVPGQAHWNSWSFWTKIIHLFFFKSKSGLWIAAQ